MIQYGVLEMDVIYNLLGPSDDEIMKNAEKELSEAKEFVKKLTVVSTNQDSKKDDDNGDGVHDDHESLVASNQKFGLLKALLDVGAWTHAEEVISRLPIYYAVAKPAIAKALANLIHVKMAPVHKKFSGLGDRIKSQIYEPISSDDRQAETFEDFKEIVLPMLLALGPYAYLDGILLYKVLRILKASLKIPTDEPGKEREKIAEPVDPNVSCLYYDVLSIMDEVMLPAVSLMESPNCCLAEEVWTNYLGICIWNDGGYNYLFI